MKNIGMRGRHSTLSVRHFIGLMLRYLRQLVILVIHIELRMGCEAAG